MNAQIGRAKLPKELFDCANGGLGRKIIRQITGDLPVSYREHQVGNIFSAELILAQSRAKN